MFHKLVIATLLFAASKTLAQNLTIEGVADRQVLTDTASFRVVTNAGFSYGVTLNGVPLPAGVVHQVTRMDYYDLTVARTNTTTSEVTNVLVRFIVLSSRRGSPELGLVEWVPLPPISSSAAEVAGAHLDLVAPARYPAGLDIPLIARVENVSGEARRVNGWVRAPGYEAHAFRILRGVGFGFLPPALAGTNISFAGQLQGLTASKVIEIESNTTWTTVSGILPNTTWPTNSRIHVTGNLTIPAGVQLNIEAGTVVKLNAGVNITNSGRTVINGTPTDPVVFTSTNRVAPEQHTGAWGGFFLRGASAALIANNAIMTGAGAQRNMSFSPGTSHRSEQPVLYVHSGAHVRMTNCAVVNNAGQIGNGYFSTITLERTIWQRAITVGEYQGCTNIVRNSALIEFPSVDGIYDAEIADSDYDGYYAIEGTNYFANSLVGFCKDDAIDAGSGGRGGFVVTNCWIESALHEALAWSGEGRRTWTYNTVLMNSGQGLEAGWSSGTPPSPVVFAENLFSTANSVGARYGDNYTGNTGLGLKHGTLEVTNSFILHNYRDVWGQVWDNWSYRTGAMTIRSNFLTAPNTNHPANTVWDPARDGARLAQFMSTPPDAPVGIGLALWDDVSVADLTNGIPVRLSSFTTQAVSIEFVIETPSGSLTNGTLTFTAGETVKRIAAPASLVAGAASWRVALRNPFGAELTDQRASYFVDRPAASTLVAAGSAWRYLDDGSNQGTTWRAPVFDDSSWSNGVGQLGFGDNDEATRIRRTNATGANIITFYFRRAFTVSDPDAFGTLSMRMTRDDGGVVYLNGTEVYRSPSMPPAPTVITSSTFANAQGSAPSDNTVDNAALPVNLLVAGTNVIAVEIHQFDAGSSDASFDLSLTGNPAGPASNRLDVVRFGNELSLSWGGGGFVLESAPTVLGPWTFVSTEGSVTVETTGQRFFRLRRP
jgi:hypothetical protein